MPAPADYVFSDAVKTTANTGVRDAIDGGAGAGVLNIYDASDNLLVAITLDDPCGTVSSGGQLTITATSAGTAIADGTASWGEFTDSTGTWVLQAPVAAGASAVSGDIVLSSIAIVTGAELTLVSATVG